MCITVVTAFVKSKSVKRSAPFQLRCFERQYFDRSEISSRKFSRISHRELRSDRYSECTYTPSTSHTGLIGNTIHIKTKIGDAVKTNRWRLPKACFWSQFWTSFLGVSRRIKKKKRKNDRRNKTRLPSNPPFGESQIAAEKHKKQ